MGFNMIEEKMYAGQVQINIRAWWEKTDGLCVCKKGGGFRDVLIVLASVSALVRDKRTLSTPTNRQFQQWRILLWKSGVAEVYIMSSSKPSPSNPPTN